MTKTLFDGTLIVRPLGRRAVRVTDLHAWCGQRGEALPLTRPNVAEFELVQLEALLCAIERGVRVELGGDVIDAAYAITTEFEPVIDSNREPCLPQAVKRKIRSILTAASAVDPLDHRQRAMIEDGDYRIALWVLGADAHVQWRRRLNEALEAGNLRAIDGLTGLAMGGAAEAGVTRIKRHALVSKHSDRWPKVNRDLRDASSNGLSEAARLKEKGWWHEEKAIAWATERGHYSQSNGSAASVFHTIKR